MTSIDRVVFPTDFSEASRRALAYAAQWAEAFGAELHVLHVKVLHDLQGSEEGSFPAFQEYFQAISTRTGELMDRLLETRNADSLEIHRATRRGTSAAPEILSYVNDMGADLVVMATHGRRGLRRLFLGSVAQEVVREARCPVLTVRESRPGTERPGSGSIAVAIDFSAQSARALDWASRISRWTGAAVDLLHVVEIPHPPAIYDAVPEPSLVSMEKIETESRERLHRMIGTAGLDPDLTRLHVLEGTPATRILEWTEQAVPDLLVVGSHGRTGAARFVLGSVAERVVNQAPCPVLTVKGEGPSKGEG